MALSRRLRRRAEERDGSLSMVDWARLFTPGQSLVYNGVAHQAFKVHAGNRGGHYYDNNSIVFACEMNRLLLFSEARFQFQRLRDGRPGDLFGTEALAILETPWAGATTRDLMVQAELDVAEHGNSYWVRDGNGLLRLEPTKMSILTEGAPHYLSGAAIGQRLVAYAYDLGKGEVQILLPDEVAHYKPVPDRKNRFVGMSWLSPCLEDVEADEEMTTHKVSQLRNRGNLDLVVTIDKSVSKEQFEAVVSAYKANHEGAHNAGKPLFITGGVDVKTVGQTFEQLSMKATQGAGETRIAACAGVPPVIVGLSEGLASATYSNYGQARRRLSDGTMRPLWGAFAAAMQTLVPPPRDARLWYDDRDIPWVREDIKDQAEIRSRQALTIESLIRSGFKPETVVPAALSGDFARLQHTGLYSVQLQPPGADAPLPARMMSGDELKAWLARGYTLIEIDRPEMGASADLLALPPASE